MSIKVYVDHMDTRTKNFIEAVSLATILTTGQVGIPLVLAIHHINEVRAQAAENFPTREQIKSPHPKTTPSRVP